jgi:polysaccharide pyruvyl transferase WcaK-like protein
MSADGRLRSVPSRLPQYARLAGRRTKVRLSMRPAVAVLSGVGDENFGDEWMFQALEQGMPRCQLVPIELPMTERRLARAGLGGPMLFSGLIIGGGTLINRYFLERVKPLLATEIPTWMIGTGVGSAGFGVSEAAADPEAWSSYLPSFRQVTVRGPRSALRLAGANPVVLGDLALFHTPAEPEQTAGRSLALVNISGTDREAAIQGLSEDDVIESASRAVRRLRGGGWRCAPLVVHRDDELRLARLGDRVGGWDGPTVRVRDDADAARAMASAGALVAMRLHAAVLGWMYGVPTVALAYRDKTHDLAEHLGADERVVDLRTSGPIAVEQMVGTVLQTDRKAEQAIRDRALLSRGAIRALLRSVESELTGTRISASGHRSTDGSRRP